MGAKTIRWNDVLPKWESELQLTLQESVRSAAIREHRRIHAVEGDVLSAAPLTWHPMAAEAPQSF
jgi:hypothetical protein